MKWTHLVLSSLLALTTSTAQAQFTCTTNNGAITITGYMGPGGAVNIPDQIGSLPVTGIGNLSFHFLQSLTVLTIPNRVTSVGNFAFEVCQALTNVAIGRSVTNIGSGAFLYCTSLPNVTIPNSVTFIRDEAFDYCLDLTNVTIGEGVQSIGEDAFADCALTNVTIPGGVTNIGALAFLDCPLTSIHVAAQNSAYSSANGVMFDKAQTAVILFPGAVGGSYTIPNTIIRIGDSAFEASRLSNLTIPDSVTSIGVGAFADCGGLTNVVIGNSVTNIADGAFYGCGSLTSMKIPDSVTSIGISAFYACNKLKTVTIGRRVVNIGPDAFAACQSLANIYFAGDAPAVVPSVFEKDSGLVKVYYLPDSVGWGDSLGGVPTALWLPQAQTGDGSFGVRSNQFSFNISWASGQTVLVEVATNLSHPIWTPLATNVFTTGTFYFSDAAWTNHPQRFYRVRSP